MRGLIIMCSIVVSSSLFGQSFEGTITYSLEAFNPRPDIIPDSLWQYKKQEEWGGEGKVMQTYYYKGTSYMCKSVGGVNVGYQLYNADDSLIYTWKEGQDTAVTIDSRKALDEFVGIQETEERDTVLGMSCKVVIVKSKYSTSKIWYSKEHFQLDYEDFEKHKYGNWGEIIKVTGSIPLRVETEGFMTHTIQEVVDYKRKSLSQSVFDVPAFDYVMPSPIN